MTIMNGIYYIFDVIEQYIKVRTGIYIMMCMGVCTFTCASTTAFIFTAIFS